MQVQYPYLNSDSWPQPTSSARRASGQLSNTHHHHNNNHLDTPNSAHHNDHDDTLALNRTDQLFTELQRIIENSGASSPLRDNNPELLDLGHCKENLRSNHSFGGRQSFGKMPPKKSGRAMLREEGALDLPVCLNTSRQERT